jgi:50S ribosomal subunit-associated GTPase HflX
MPSVAIVGYTNAGKSWLLNALVGSDSDWRGRCAADGRLGRLVGC